MNTYPKKVKEIFQIMLLLTLRKNNPALFHYANSELNSMQKS
jgi:hypothetical protein